jgi:hypothetical protein
MARYVMKTSAKKGFEIISQSLFALFTLSFLHFLPAYKSVDIIE